MYRPLTSAAPRTRRRGTILIVVLALLALFAVIGLSFVFYADSEATAARIHREGESGAAVDGGVPDSYYEDSVNGALAALIFDADDRNAGLLCGMRGHSLVATYVGRIPLQAAPYSGVGAFHEPSPAGADRAQWVNYSAPFNGNWVDPEWTGARNAGQLGMSPGVVTGLNQSYVPKNAPYTYPDLNNYYLASISPATGEVVVPSFHRAWLFNSNNPNLQYRLAPWDPTDTSPSTNKAANTDWVTPEGRTKIVRPRPVDQLTPAEINSALGGSLTAVPPGLAGLTAAQQIALASLINTKIANGEIIPYPPANADGSYTADIQNLLGGVGVQKNDSVLIDVGLPARPWNGKLIKPLVSVLVADLDGLLNLNTIGNVRNTAAPAGYTKHVSYAGYGPWEINLARAFDPTMLNTSLMSEADNLVFTRYGAGATNGPVGARNTLAVLPYDRSGARFPMSSLVNWDGTGQVNSPSVLLPTFAVSPPNAFQVSPTFTNAPMGPLYFDDNTTAGKGQNHPALFNPNDWPSVNTGVPRTFPVSDLKRLFVRYAADLPWYQQMDLYKTASPPNQSLVGTFPAGSSYRLDPAHYRRMLFTTLSAGLDRPGHVGNFNTVQPGAALQLNTGVYPPLPMYPQSPYPGPFPSQSQPTGGTQISDYNYPNTGTWQSDYRNARAVGPVDLNRPLADYRNDPTTPLHPLNMGNTAQAWADRHNLARDIFVRLAVAAGGQITLDPSGSPTVMAAPGTAEYNALRYLAQLAVNMVDYIDGDDVSTLFVWNPVGGGSNQPLPIIPAAGMVSFVPGATNGFNPTDMQNRVVFGVEKPRLVINEAYSEIINDITDPARSMAIGNGNPQKDGIARFWIELLNPTTNAYAGGAGQLGNAAGTPRTDGAVQLYYNPAPAVGDPAGTPTYSPYLLQIARAQQTAGQFGTAYLVDPSNVTGRLGLTGGGAYNPDAQYDFSTVTANNKVVFPNNGTLNGAPAPGVALVGPKPLNPPTAGQEFDPAAAAAPPWNNMIQANAVGTIGSTVEYTVPVNDLKTLDTTDPNSPYQRHVVLLRRLANPYLPPNDPATGAYNPANATNPYITVDFVDWVPANDGVFTGNGGSLAMPGGVLMANRFSVGKVQPYTAYSQATAALMNQPTYSFPSSCVLAQNPAGGPPANEPKHTFGRHNHRDPSTPPGGPNPTYTLGPPAQINNPAGETLMAPFDWLVHFDRPLANQLELLSMQACKPHEVTQLTVRPAGGGGIRRDLPFVPWFGVNPTTNQPGYDFTTTNRTNNGLFRTLDLLRVKPWMYGAGLGGRVHGRVNINTVQDLRVLQAMLDAPPPPWTTGTAYGVGSQVTNAGNLYVCVSTTTGMSGPAPGPTGTTNPIIDGGVTWNFAGFASGNMFNTMDVAALWPSLIGSRTVTIDATRATANGTPVPGGVPVPGPTVDDTGNPAPGTDRPFKSLGVGEFSPGGIYGYTAGSGLQDTLLRLNPTNGLPLLWSGNPNVYLPTNPPNVVPHPYLQAEIARKLMNNVTTTSNAFAITITVVFHEVRGQAPEIPGYPRDLLGREAYKDVPGDLRQQFFAVADRSNIGIVPGTNNTFQGQPFFTALEQTMYPDPMTGTTGTLYLSDVAAFSAGASVTVYADGQPVQIGLGTTLAVGVGTNQDVVTVTGVNVDGSLVVSSGVTLKPHAAGECVSNSVTGNPGVPGVPGGPPPFDRVTNPNSVYRFVVPYISRVR